MLYQIYSQADTERIVEEKQMEDNFYRDLNDNRFGTPEASVAAAGHTSA